MATAEQGQTRQESDPELELPTPPLALRLYHTSQRLLFFCFALPLHWLCFGLFPLLPAPGPAGKSKQRGVCWLLPRQSLSGPYSVSAEGQRRSGPARQYGPESIHRLPQNTQLREPASSPAGSRGLQASQEHLAGTVQHNREAWELSAPGWARLRPGACFFNTEDELPASTRHVGHRLGWLFFFLRSSWMSKLH